VGSAFAACIVEMAICIAQAQNYIGSGKVLVYPVKRKGARKEKRVYMPGATQRRGRSRKRSLKPAVLRLAFWQLRRTWFLLLFISLGMIAAVVIACAIPLLSDLRLPAINRRGF
jgi:hypothetical protein